MSSNQRQVLKKTFCINFLLPVGGQSAFAIALLGHPLFLLSLFQIWTSRVLKKQMAIPMESLAAAQVGTASGLCQEVFEVELAADVPPCTVRSSCRACSTGGSGKTT